MTVTPKTKQGGKTPKHTKAEFERVLTELEKQSREFRTTPAQSKLHNNSPLHHMYYLYSHYIYPIHMYIP
ncbi:hypothetical protein EON63_20680 [archaeon]|nr:MAG: hypothetical protein EON63_20680 [archaeon]